MALNFTVLSAHSFFSRNKDKNLISELPYKLLVDATLPNKQEYCTKYNYKLSIKQSEDNDITLTKHVLIKENLLAKESDWLCWIDTDALIMNMQVSLDSFIVPNAEFIIGEDWNGLNSGIFLIKVCNNAIKFMDSVMSYIPTDYDKAHTPYWWYTSEQCAYTRSLSYINTAIVHHSFFNGYIIGPRPDNDWRNYNIGPFDPNWQEKRFSAGDFILHFVGDYLPNKINNAKKYIKEIIR